MVLLEGGGRGTVLLGGEGRAVKVGVVLGRVVNGMELGGRDGRVLRPVE